jgi:hypothetical protein
MDCPRLTRPGLSLLLVPNVPGATFIPEYQGSKVLCVRLSLGSVTTAVKFIYFEKATKCCEISTVDLSYVVLVKSTVENSQDFVAFSEYMNFNQKIYSTHINKSL